MTTPVSSSRPTRENIAERLLKGSAKKSYAPAVDIDWDAPLDPDKFFLPPHTVTLYGTPLWDAMTREQQIELSRQELVNILSAGIWFENILNQALLRDLMHRDVRAASTHYSLTELGDETRHMVMFGKVIERLGADPVQPRRWQRAVINALPLLFRGPILWGAALVGEEIFDALQRQILEDPELQPIVQRLMRIHVTEEARHIQYARDGLRRTRPHMGFTQRFVMSNLHGVGGPFYRYLLTIPAPYRRMGLDARAARRMALANNHHRSRKEAGFAPLASFFEEIDLMGPIARRMWRRSGFLPR
ncbi:diiron oxygenase [Mycobacterium sp. 852014-52144_SCH5372336]|uniref:AurF N-oxygenase family protein n=1 Tax=Mycobacterium sp. 852014-52144_SCH5372336 TaxID=1834115 RepID=UPI0007FE8346|nr:diiron oxygenase [Mycobacterium sp. 852014-52144_SCH5372336]OBB72924.1 aminobenzoate oxygenase [Mycobacterium sp. 852014-52144_SCH5372336]